MERAGLDQTRRRGPQQPFDRLGPPQVANGAGEVPGVLTAIDGAIEPFDIGMAREPPKEAFACCLSSTARTTRRKGITCIEKAALASSGDDGCE